MKAKTTPEDELNKEVCELRKRVAELEDWKARHTLIEDSLRESENLFHRLVEKATAGVYVIQDGKIEYVNPAAEYTFGYEVSELSGKSSKFPIFPEDWPLVEENSRRRLSGEVEAIKYQFRGVRKDGAVIWLETFGSVMEYQGRPAIIGTLTDITDRVQTERDLRLERQRFQVLSEHAPHGLAMISKEGEFNYVNPRFKELFGYGLQDIPVGIQWFNMAFPDLTEKPATICTWLKELEECEPEMPMSREFDITGKDGLKKVVRSRAVQLDNGDHLMTCEDITERKKEKEALIKREAELRASYAQFQAFMDNGPIIAFMRDDQGRYVYVNKVFLNINKFSSAQVLGKTAYQIWPEEMAYKVTKEDINVLESNVTVSTVESLVYHTGHERDWWLFRFPIQDADGRKYVGGVGLDLTQRIKAQKALEANEARFRQIYERVPIMIHSSDRDGIVRNVNSKWLSHMGYDRDEVIGRRLHNFLLPDPALPEGTWRTELWANGIVSNVQRQWIKKDGSLIDVVLDAIIIDDPILGRVTLTAVHDITGLKRAEEQIKKSLEEKEILLREINHRVKNNLQIISSLLRLQSRQVPHDGYSLMLRDTQNRLYTMALIHEKLYQSKEVIQIDVEPYLRSLVAHLFYLHGARSSRIEPIIEAYGIQLKVDKADPLGLIANELVSNCLKYAFPRDGKGVIRIALSLESHEFEFVVSDNGVGLGDDFDLSNVETLGLHLVTALVRQLHGVITVKRTEGTEVRIRFPA